MSEIDSHTRAEHDIQLYLPIYPSELLQNRNNFYCICVYNINYLQYKDTKSYFLCKISSKENLSILIKDGKEIQIMETEFYIPSHILTGLKNKKLYKVIIINDLLSICLVLDKEAYLFPTKFNRQIINYYFKDILNNQESTIFQNVYPQEIYAILHKIKKEHIIHKTKTDVFTFINGLPFLKSKLRQYQIESVAWMIHREISNLQTYIYENQHFLPVDKSCFVEDPCYVIHNELVNYSLISYENRPLFINYEDGSVATQIPLILKNIHGGILADEMGLGKTVELFALILIYTRQNIVSVLTSLSNLIKDTKGKLHVVPSKFSNAQNTSFIRYITNQFLPIIKSLEMEDKQKLAHRILALLSDITQKIVVLDCDAKINCNPNEVTCICGPNRDMVDRKEKRLLQCYICLRWQHPKCVNFDSSFSRDSYGGSFVCCYCAIHSFTYQSGATLIITPNSISEQWLTEMHKHINLHAANIKIMRYKGVHRLSRDFVYPDVLASQDIVITTYEVLTKELEHADLSYSTMRDLRSPKRFLSLPSPLMCIDWWRICLDEAQMVESPVTKVAKMASYLKSFNRWCITGTPIQKGADDLYGLLSFLGVKPYKDKRYWERGILGPLNRGNSKPFVDLFSQLLWRTSKDDVLDQLGIPPNVETVYRLTFSPVEAHFYHRQYSESLTLTQKAIRDGAAADHGRRGGTVGDPKGGSKDSESLGEPRTITPTAVDSAPPSSLEHRQRSSVGAIKSLLFPLTRLRLACCHPQIVLTKMNAKRPLGTGANAYSATFRGPFRRGRARDTDANRYDSFYRRY